MMRLIEHLGRYEIGPEIGRGGMSIVYRGYDPSLRRDVALKVLHPHLALRADSRARFSREAQAVARMHHPNIVEVFDFSAPDSEQAYIVTELVQGPTLRQLISEHPLRYAELAALILLPIGQALAHAHQMGIIHRDVKPENIMIRADGSPVLMDFGIAQMVDMESLTATGTMLGSPAHMAPEVVDGQPVTPKSDVFSLATVLYWLVCGTLPFSGQNPAALFRRVLECQYDPVLRRRPQAGKSMARLIESCLTRNVDERPTTPDVVEQLKKILQEAGLSSEDELAVFLKDPEPYQDQLAVRMAPALAGTAQQAFAKHMEARALDFIDRALHLDKNCAEALQLLKQIEWHSRKSTLIKAASGVALLAAAAGIGVVLWPKSSTQSRTLSNPAPIATGMEILPSDPVASFPASTLNPEPLTPISAVSAENETAAVNESAAVDASAAVDETSGTPTENTVRNDQSLHVESPSNENTSSKPVPPKRPYKVTDGKDDPAARRPRPPRVNDDKPVSTQEIEPLLLTIHGRYKGAEVFLDGQSQGYLSTIERKGGLPIKALGVHQIRFQNQGCQPEEYSVQVNAQTKRLPQIAFECTPLPASIQILSNRNTLIRDEGNQILGQTNQVVSIPMEALDRKMTLTIGNPNEDMGVQTRSITLKAGKTVVEKVNF